MKERERAREKEKEKETEEREREREREREGMRETKREKGATFQKCWHPSRVLLF